MLSVTIWLVPARKENIAVNVPPYLNAETTVLQDINDTGYFQASAQALDASSMLPRWALPSCALCMHPVSFTPASANGPASDNIYLQKAMLKE